MVRGKLASQEKDFKAARCWLSLGARWGFAPAQSALAALVIKGDNGAKPDYALAFRLASDSAQAGDTTGQILLASLYRNGQGTPQDNQKAEYWVKRAEQTKSAALWNQLTINNVYGFSPLEIAGFAFNLFTTTDPETEKRLRIERCGAVPGCR